MLLVAMMFDVDVFAAYQREVQYEPPETVRCENIVQDVSEEVPAIDASAAAVLSTTIAQLQQQCADLPNDALVSIQRETLMWSCHISTLAKLLSADQVESLPRFIQQELPKPAGFWFGCLTSFPSRLCLAMTPAQDLEVSAGELRCYLAALQRLLPALRESHCLLDV